MCLGSPLLCVLLLRGTPQLVPSVLRCCCVVAAAGRVLQRVAFRVEKKAPEMRSGGRVCWSLDGRMRAARCLHPGRQRGGCGCRSGVGVALFDVRLRVSPVQCNRFCGIVSVWVEVSSWFFGGPHD